MLRGQTVNPNQIASPDGYLTPWFPRGGDGGTFVLEVIDFLANGSLAIAVTMQSKNSEQADSSATDLTTLNVSTVSVGLHDQEFGSALELVRFRIRVTSSDDNDWVHLRMLNVSWATN